MKSYDDEQLMENCYDIDVTLMKSCHDINEQLMTILSTNTINGKCEINFDTEQED